MKSSKLILALWLGASALAQTQALKPQGDPSSAVKPALARKTPAPPPAPAAKPAPVITKPSATQNAKPAAEKPSAAPVRHHRVHPAPVTPPKPVPAPAPAATKLNQKKSKKPAPVVIPGMPLPATEVKEKGKPIVISGQRDPFVSPVVERVRAAAACTGSGRQCLAVGEISLHGVVRASNGLIAVVVNGEHTYFLRENDPLADGSVERITKDSIILRERTSDALGRPQTREVTRKLGAPAI